ncbi:MAG: hypothetical protein ABIR94_20775 [Rubrivivax sp.]
MMPSIADEIAAMAARLVVEEGMEYGAAKRKAARQTERRVRPGTELPSNERVEDEVRAHLELFCADTQPAELLALRQIAARWLQRLAEFRPHLSGAVWRGTATRHSSIHIDLYCDDSKGAEIALINQGIDYDVEGPVSDAQVAFLRLAEFSEALKDTVTIHLAVRDLDDQRGALKPDARGRSWRGDALALQRLLSVAEPAS